MSVFLVSLARQEEINESLSLSRQKYWEIKPQSIDLEDVPKGDSLQNVYKECRKGMGDGRGDKERLM